MKYFVRANTCTGEVNFLSNNLNGIEKIDETIYNLNVISDEEHNVILPSKIGEITEYPKDKSLIELFLVEKEKYPDKVALVYNGQKVTYNELNIRAMQIQSLLNNCSINVRRCNWNNAKQRNRYSSINNCSFKIRCKICSAG